MEQIQKTLVISRIFNAPREKVWRAWTEPEEIMKWWGPEHFTSPSCKVDFRVGGKYLFCMHGAAGPGAPEMDFWSGGTYHEIVPMERIVYTDGFANEKGELIKPADYGMDPNFPVENQVTATFEDAGEGKTKLIITYLAESDAVLLAMKNVQMEAGWKSSLDKFARAVE